MDILYFLSGPVHVLHKLRNSSLQQKLYQIVSVSGMRSNIWSEVYDTENRTSQNNCIYGTKCISMHIIRVIDRTRIFYISWVGQFMCYINYATQPCNKNCTKLSRYQECTAIFDLIYNTENGTSQNNYIYRTKSISMHIIRVNDR